MLSTANPARSKRRANPLSGEADQTERIPRGFNALKALSKPRDE